MVRSGFFKPNSSQNLEFSLQAGDLQARVKVRGKAIHLPDWDRVHVEMYFHFWLNILIKMGLDHLIPIFIWFNTATLPRQVEHLGSSSSKPHAIFRTSMVLSEAEADAIHEMRLSKMDAYREEALESSGFGSSRGHPALTWQQNQQERMMIVASGAAPPETTSGKVKISYTLPRDVLNVSQEEMWDPWRCGNCAEAHRGVLCPKARRAGLLCTFCLSGEHKECDCTGPALHPLTARYFKDKTKLILLGQKN